MKNCQHHWKILTGTRYHSSARVALDGIGRQGSDMRMVVEVFREADGRLQGVLEMADGRRDAFVSTLDLLRVLEGLDLPRDPGTEARPSDGRDFRPDSEVERG